MWYFDTIGEGKLPIVDTWWQTETGGILISPLPGAIAIKPGSATPVFRHSAEDIKEDGKEAKTNEGGYLTIEKPWPGMLRGMYNDPENKRMKEVYFSRFPGYYLSGDGARIDEDGDYWLMGRIDDVLNVSGHRLGTAEVESALVAHSSVSEAAVVGFPSRHQRRRHIRLCGSERRKADNDEMKKNSSSTLKSNKPDRKTR